MPNANTIARLVGADSPAQGTLAIPTFVQGSSTSAQIVTPQTGTAAFLQAVTAAAGVSQFNTANAGGVNFDGLTFKVRVSGRVTTTGSTNITVAIMQANSATTTYTSGNVIATSAATAVNTTSANFHIEATCLWDSKLQKLNGFQIGAFNNTLIAAAALTNQVSVTAQSNLGFELAVTSSAASTASFFISEFCLETL